MNLEDLSKELNKREIELSELGIETLHVVYALKRKDDKVEYDRKTNSVSLKI